MKQSFFNGAVFMAALVLWTAGCSNPKITNTGRNAIEQLLISSAVDRSIAQLDFKKFAGKKIKIDYSNLAPQVDKSYVQGAFEAHLAAAGLIIALKPAEAEYTFRIVSGVLATDDSQFMFGTPPLPIPMPYTDISFAIPELPFFKKVTRIGVCQLTVEVLEAATNGYVCTAGPARSSSVNINWTVLFFPFTTRDFVIAPHGEMNVSWFE